MQNSSCSEAAAIAVAKGLEAIDDLWTQNLLLGAEAVCLWGYACPVVAAMALFPALSLKYPPYAHP